MLLYMQIIIKLMHEKFHLDARMETLCMYMYKHVFVNSHNYYFLSQNVVIYSPLFISVTGI